MRRMSELWLGSQRDPGGATAYFGDQVGPHIGAARREIGRADRRLVSLVPLAENPSTPQDYVEQELAEFLAWAAQSRVRLDSAIKAAGDESLRRWWDRLDRDDELLAFRDYRHAALKRVESPAGLITLKLMLDDSPPRLSFWAFTGGRYADDPVVARCQKHLERLRDLLAEVSERLPATAELGC